MVSVVACSFALSTTSIAQSRSGALDALLAGCANALPNTCVDLRNIRTRKLAA
jgi:hypothetical protein